ncbi:MAG: Forkhead-associated protein [Chthoniobacter sp.]|nr:Forkhead-associated protein [Chthoniobacter sp.]
MLIGQRLADRYELLEEALRTAGGRVFRARDVVHSEVVAIKPLDASATAGGGIHRLGTEVRRVQQAAHPGLLRYDAVLVQERLVVREWLHGFSLLELLRWRKQLTAAETLRLLATLPATLDFMTDAGLALSPQPLAKILIGLDTKAAPKEIATQPLATWPPFVLKVNPLRLRASLSSMDGQTTLTSVAELQTATTDPAIDAPRCLAGLLYELLGGHVRPARETRYSPVAALREDGNAVLRRALIETPYPNCRALWADLERAEPIDAPAPAHVPKLVRSSYIARIPEPLLRFANPSTALKLASQDPTSPSVHLVARGSFAIGRSVMQADCLTRFFPETPTHNELTCQLSRVHATAEATDRGIILRDGNGALASVNGSRLDGEPLDAVHGRVVQRRALLTLGEVYHLEIVPLLGPQPRSLEIPNIAAWTGPAEARSTLAGATVFLPSAGQPLLRHAIWLFSEIGFGLDFARHLVWDTRGNGESRAMFHYYRGCFWIRNNSLPEGVLEVAGSPVARGEIAPLAADQALRVGTLHFTVEAA